MTAPWPRPPRHPSGRGIDLGRWHDHVRRIVVAEFGERAEASGIDPDDLVSGVYERIERANRGRHPYDPRRASMSRYVCICAHSTWANMLRHRAARPQEVLGLPDAEGRLVDVALAPIEAPQASSEEAAILDVARDPDHARALLLMAEGATDDEVLEASGDHPLVRRELEARRGRGARRQGAAPLRCSVDGHPRGGTPRKGRRQAPPRRGTPRGEGV